MTTPGTSAVRAWARENGYDVSDRGRLPAEITDAYAAAHRKGAAAKAAPKKPAAVKAVKAPARKAAAAPVKKKSAAEPAKQESEQPDVQPPAAPAAQSTDKGSPAPKPSPVADDRRLVALGEELTALTKRVAALESQLKGKNGKSEGGKTPRFRRSK